MTPDESIGRERPRGRTAAHASDRARHARHARTVRTLRCSVATASLLTLFGAAPSAPTASTDPYASLRAAEALRESDWNLTIGLKPDRVKIEKTGWSISISGETDPLPNQSRGAFSFKISRTNRSANELRDERAKQRAKTHFVDRPTKPAGKLLGLDALSYYASPNSGGPVTLEWVATNGECSFSLEVTGGSAHIEALLGPLPQVFGHLDPAAPEGGKNCRTGPTDSNGLLSETSSDAAGRRETLSEADRDPLGTPWRIIGPKCTTSSQCQKRCTESGDAAACAWTLSPSILRDWLRCERRRTDDEACSSVISTLWERGPESRSSDLLARAAVMKTTALCVKGYDRSCAALTRFLSRWPSAFSYGNVKEQLAKICQDQPEICAGVEVPGGASELDGLCSRGWSWACGAAMTKLGDSPVRRETARNACAKGDDSVCRAIATIEAKKVEELYAEGCRRGSRKACRAWFGAAGAKPHEHPSGEYLKAQCITGKGSSCGEIFHDFVDAFATDGKLMYGALRACAAGNAEACLLANQMGRKGGQLPATWNVLDQPVKDTVLRRCSDGWEPACALLFAIPGATKLESSTIGCYAGSPMGCLSAWAAETGKRKEQLMTNACALLWFPSCDQLPDEQKAAAQLLACHEGMSAACIAFSKAHATALMGKGDTKRMITMISSLKERAVSLDPAMIGR